MKLAGDPWGEPGKDLDVDTPEGSEILGGITDILASWPMENTGLLGDEDRHLRFILAVSGYPEIDVATRPFDWPLHEKSVEALRISRMIDDVEGMHQGTSLRSSILNRDMCFRHHKQDLNVAHEECLLALFARARQLDGKPLDQGHYFDEEIALLTVLHTQDNARRSKWWPDLSDARLQRFEQTLDFPPPEKPDMKEALMHGKESTQFREAKQVQAEWKIHKEFESFNIPERETTQVSFQFHHVQSWIDSVVPSGDFKGTIQRFVRGASLLLELVSSEALQRIARAVGIGSIIVDGGGRVSFLCPDELLDEVIESIEMSTSEFLSIDGQKSYSGNSIRLRTTLNNWARACLIAGQGVSGADSPKSDDYELWFRQVRAKLPPISVRRTIAVDDKTDSEPDSIADVVTSLEGTKPPVVDVLSGQDERCCTCCDGEMAFDQARRVDSWMGLDGKDGPTDMACPFLRLIYFLGHDQRLKDSTLRIRGEVKEPAQRDHGRTRAVTSIAVLDGNSLGVVFAERYLDGNSISQRLDRTRRRSFRFNCHWWESIQTSINKYGSGDVIAAWVTAGDDVILAQYSETPTEGEKLESPELLYEMIVDLAGRIEVELDNEIFLSFGAGIATKEAGERISDQLSRARGLEKVAKDIWKTRASEEWGIMLELPARWEGDQREKKTLPPRTEWEEGDWVARSVIISDPSRSSAKEPEEGDASTFPFDDGWGSVIDDAVGHAVEELGIDGGDFRSILSWLSRHHVRRHHARAGGQEGALEKTTLVVMPPKTMPKKNTGIRMLVPVGGSRANILAACKVEGVQEVHLLATKSLFNSEAQVLRLLSLIKDHLEETPKLYFSLIDGPEAGPDGCRDSIVEWKDGAISPDAIFVTASTTLIAGVLSYEFPSADLLSLRGDRIVSLSDGTTVSNVEKIHLDEYLTIHGIDVAKEGDAEGVISLNGDRLNAPALSDWRMEGNMAILTWKTSLSHENEGDRATLRTESQLIVSSIRKIVESAGVGAFRFNVFGYGHFAANSSDPRIVNTQEKLS